MPKPSSIDQYSLILRCFLISIKIFIPKNAQSFSVVVWNIPPFCSACFSDSSLINNRSHSTFWKNLNGWRVFILYIYYAFFFKLTFLYNYLSELFSPPPLFIILRRFQTAQWNIVVFGVKIRKFASIDIRVRITWLSVSMLFFIGERSLPTSLFLVHYQEAHTLIYLVN